MKIFMGGRLCLLGEHSDWVSSYKVNNPRISNGKAIVTGLNLGIYANIEKSNIFEINMPTNYPNLCIKFNTFSLKNYINNKGFFSYACGSALQMLKKYKVSGLKINIEKITLPIKKGLSSSAAICLLIIKSFNEIYNLNLTPFEIMKLAYLGEREAGSNCGMLDEICLLGNKTHIVNFFNGEINYEVCSIKKNIYMVVCDLDGNKNTQKILSDLNNSFPYPKNLVDKRLHHYFNIINNKLVEKAVCCLKYGKIKKLGTIFNKAQKLFDKFVAPKSKELIAPLLHKYLKDKYIKSLTYGGKGVGSQGDGTVQFIAKNSKCQKEIIAYLKQKGLDAYGHTIFSNDNSIDTAFIPVAGNGTRLYPYTKVCKKEFFPVIHNNLLKPQISVLLEELFDCGIKKIYLTIANHKQYLMYKDYFKNKPKYNNEIQKLSIQNYEDKLSKIWSCLHFIYNKKIKLGFAYSISLFSKYFKGNSLLCLGDTLYRGNNDCCINQLIKTFNSINQNVVGICEIPLQQVVNYGVCKTKSTSISNIKLITKFVEKPSKNYAKQFLCNDNKYYGFAGCYIISPKVFEELKSEINKNKGRADFTKCLDVVRQKYGYFGYIIEGRSFDFGNINAIKTNFTEFAEGDK